MKFIFIAFQFQTMPLRYYIGFLLCCCCALIPSSTATEFTPTNLVQDVCIKANHTANYYNFCINSLYSDPRTPTADRFVLAYVSFDLAYLNATHTNHTISLLLHQHNSSASLTTKLRLCQSYYGKAIRALASAINDLNSDTFYELGRQAVRADHAARDSEATFEGDSASGLLSVMNYNLRGLSNICLVVSTLFTASETTIVSFRGR